MSPLTFWQSGSIWLVLGNVMGLRTHVGWCYGWLQVWVRDASLQPSLNPYLRHGFDRSQTGWWAFWHLPVSVIELHMATQLWFSPTTTFTAHHPSHSQLQPTAHTCPSPLQRDVGWLVLTRLRGMAGRTQGGTQQMGGPVGMSREWAMTHGPFSLIPLSWTPTTAPSTSRHVGCVDPTTHTSLQTWREPAHPMPWQTWWPPQCQTPPGKHNPWITTNRPWKTHETTWSPIKPTIYPQQPSAQDQWLSDPRKAAWQCPLTLALPLWGSLVISEGITPCGLGYPWVFVNPWPVPMKTHASGRGYGFWWVRVWVTLENPRVACDIPYWSGSRPATQLEFSWCVICISWNLRDNHGHPCSHKDEHVHVCSFCGSKHHNAFSWTYCMRPSNWCFHPCITITSTSLFRFLILNYCPPSFTRHLFRQIPSLQQNLTPLWPWHIQIPIVQAQSPPQLSTSSTSVTHR